MTGIACGYRTIKIFARQMIVTGHNIRRELMVEPRGTYHLITTEYDAFGSYGRFVCDFQRSGWSDCASMSGKHFQFKAESIAWFVAIADGEDPDAAGWIPQAPTATTPDGPEEHQFLVANASPGFLYLRNGPGPTYQEIAMMPEGTVGLVGRCVKPEGGWKPFCEVEWQGLRGWASSCCMEAAGPIPQAPIAITPDGPENVALTPTAQQLPPIQSAWRATIRTNGYTSLRTWDTYIKSTGRYIRKELFVGADGKNYLLIATDHDGVGGSNNGSTCIFNATGWSSCTAYGGNNYILKPASIRYFLKIASGADRGTAP